MEENIDCFYKSNALVSYLGKVLFILREEQGVYKLRYNYTRAG